MGSNDKLNIDDKDNKDKDKDNKDNNFSEYQ